MIVIYTNVVVDHAINHAMPMGNGAWGVRCDGTHAHVHVYMYRMFAPCNKGVGDVGTGPNSRTEQYRMFDHVDRRCSFV
jgi:hypothetical protein